MSDSEGNKLRVALRDNKYKIALVILLLSATLVALT